MLALLLRLTLVLLLLLLLKQPPDEAHFQVEHRGVYLKLLQLADQLALQPETRVAQIGIAGDHVLKLLSVKHSHFVPLENLECKCNS